MQNIQIEKDISVKNPYEQELSIWKNQPIPKIGEKFIDSFFPPNENSLLGKNINGEFLDKIEGKEKAQKISSSSIIWMRPDEIFNEEKYFLFENKIEIGDINQGKLGDCYFLAALAALTDFPTLIYQLFKIKEINQDGYYKIIIFIEGKFQIVIIDDYLPVNSKTKQVYFCKPIKNKLWVCLLEKAWAKINGGYSNISKGNLHHALEALTGCPNINYMHCSYRQDNLWELISNGYKNNLIITGSSLNNVEKYGLSNRHAYTIMECKEIINNGKKEKILKLRNPHGFKTSINEYNKSCILVDGVELNKINLNSNEKGVFYILLNDYFKYFSLTNICYILYNGYSKSYKIYGQEVFKGNIFNLYLEKDGILSVSLIRKMWRYNLEVRNLIIPTFLCITKYDPDNKNNEKYFSDYYSSFESFENTTITKELRKGFYLIYAYHDILHSSMKKEDFYLVKIDSSVKFLIKKMPSDIKENDFPLLKKIIIQNFLNKKEDQKEVLDQTNHINYLEKYNNNDLTKKIIYNSSNYWMKITEDCSNVRNIFLLSPYKSNLDSFDWFIAPKSFNILLGMIIDSTKQGDLELKSKTKILKNINYLDNDFKVFVQRYANDSVKKVDKNEKLHDYDYITMSLEEVKKVPFFQIINLYHKNEEKSYP